MAEEYQLSRNYRSNPQVDKKLQLEAVIQERRSVKTAWEPGGRQELKLFLLFFFFLFFQCI